MSYAYGKQYYVPVRDMYAVVLQYWIVPPLVSNIHDII